MVECVDSGRIVAIEWVASMTYIMLVWGWTLIMIEWVLGKILWLIYIMILLVVDGTQLMVECVTVGQALDM